MMRRSGSDVGHFSHSPDRTDRSEPEVAHNHKCAKDHKSNVGQDAFGPVQVGVVGSWPTCGLIVAQMWHLVI